MYFHVIHCGVRSVSHAVAVGVAIMTRNSSDYLPDREIDTDRGVFGDFRKVSALSEGIGKDASAFRMMAARLRSLVEQSTEL